MRLIKTPDFDLVIDLNTQEWEELAPKLQAELLLGADGRTYLARVGGAWILFLLKEGGEPESRKREKGV
ncbi:MAG: hypothetical protein QXK52_07340 [Candidatus Bathyarchaeia archaeon]